MKKDILKNEREVAPAPVEDRPRNGSVLNLSQQSDLGQEGSSSIGRGSDSDIGEPDMGSEEDMDYNVNGKDNQDKEAGAPPNAAMLHMMNQINQMIKMSVENAKQEKKSVPIQKCKCSILFEQNCHCCSQFMNSADICYQARNENMI